MNHLEIILPVGSVILLFALRLWELATRRNLIAGEKKETLTLRLFLATGTLVLISALTEFLWLRREVVWMSFAAGWAVALFSFFIRRQAIKALGKFWSLHVEIRQNHEFVRNGPFRWMRHPAYFSMILELVAGTLILCAWYSILLIPLLYVPALLLRLRIEERALLEKFGEAYRAYQQSTPALFPLKWPRTH